MLLYHVTPGENLASILDSGLLCRLSQGKLACLWSLTAANVWWGVNHVRARHSTAGAPVVILTLDVPRGWLRRYRRGIWQIWRDVPASRIVNVQRVSTIVE